MPTCPCGVNLDGRRRKCDGCKKRARGDYPGPAASAAAAPPAAPTAEIPAGLHDRGRHLWTTLGLTLDSPAGQLALEACRTADRLDELDSIIAGKGVLNLMQFRLHEHWDDEGDRTVAVEVKFQSVLTEARGQQANFAGLLGAIASKVKATDQPAPAPTAGASSPLDELARRRATSQ